jgi:hypothetical protein
VYTEEAQNYNSSRGNTPVTVTEGEVSAVVRQLTEGACNEMIEDFRIGSSLFEVALFEEAEMRGIDIDELQDTLGTNWDKVAKCRYRSI